MLAVHNRPYVAVDPDIDAVKAAGADGFDFATPRGPNCSTGSTLATPAR